MRLRTRLWIDFYVGGLLHAIVKPPVIAMGWILRRNHDLKACSEVVFVKLLGGGSLVIAYPALLALKRSGKIRKMTALTTQKNRDFAEALEVFDEVLTIRDDGFLHIVMDSIRVIYRLFRCQVIVDLEVHSRLSTILTLMTMARNRIGFYTANSFWRRGLCTHLLYCNQSVGIYHFYNQAARLLGASALSFREASEAFRAAVELWNSGTQPQSAKEMGGRWAIAPCCSELGRERMLQAGQWIRVLGPIAARQGRPYSVVLLGGPGDKKYLDELAGALAGLKPAPATIENLASRATLRESIKFLSTVEKLYTIDSSLLHFARLLAIPTESFWGPTDPADRLCPLPPAEEKIHYVRLTCSPCVHIASVPPCKGNNICMECAVDPDSGIDRNPIWLAQLP